MKEKYYTWYKQGFTMDFIPQGRCNTIEDAQRCAESCKSGRFLICESDSTNEWQREMNIAGYPDMGWVALHSEE